MHDKYGIFLCQLDKIISHSRFFWIGNVFVIIFEQFLDIQMNILFFRDQSTAEAISQIQPGSTGSD